MMASAQMGRVITPGTTAVGHCEDLVILGAGVAGLVAAYELESIGYRVTVLEGSERIGGRIHTHRFGTASDAPYAELGAIRIPSSHEFTLRYVRKLGLESSLRPFRTVLSDENNHLLTGQGFVRVKEAAGPLMKDVRRLIPEATHRRTTLLFGAWLTAFVRAVAPAEMRDRFGSDLARLLRLVDDIDLTPYVRGSRGDRIHVATVFREHPELRAGCGPRLHGFLDDLLLETDTDLLCLSGGMSQITERLAARVRGPILLGREVVGVHAVRDHVDVRLRCGGTGGTVLTLRCPAALCTLPFSVLRGLDLTGLDEDKREVVRSTEYGAATKIALHCRDAFWIRDGILGGASATGGRIRQTYYPLPEGDPAAGAALLASYAIASDAHLLGRLPAEERHVAAVDELTALWPELKEPDTVLDAVSIAWADHPWSKGCATIRWRWGGDIARCVQERKRAACPQGLLFFAGEHCSDDPAWINGAIESALAAVEAIRTRLRITR
ncbi:flavin monoamine oxidase family protein [Streptomyces sp. NPDC017890]|uniref:flavin monoamine oxidase family protein n=1 Tax=Streptomyces sp. NPDC017890 TaxID=3365015 RepID=UPI00378BA502